MAAMNFGAIVRSEQIAWRKRRLSNRERGWQNNRQYEHILPRRDWELNLFPGIRSDGQVPLASYLNANKVKTHTGVHNLCSSWILCANMYFPFRSPNGKALLAEFLKAKVSPEITAVDDIELEYEVPDVRFKPGALLGEESGQRGAGQTSPDVAFLVRTARGEGLVLTESKFTEHSFYQCSGAKKERTGRLGNPDPSRCRSFALVADAPRKHCHLVKCERLYWDHLELTPSAATISSACPAATGAYQLFRQQALANALKASGKWDLVVSAVAYDERNQALFKVIGAGRNKADVRASWTSIFGPGAAFTHFTHQDWVAWVRSRGGSEWRAWLSWVKDRYTY